MRIGTFPRGLPVKIRHHLPHRIPLYTVNLAHGNRRHCNQGMCLNYRQNAYSREPQPNSVPRPDQKPCEWTENTCKYWSFAENAVRKWPVSGEIRMQQNV